MSGPEGFDPNKFAETHESPTSESEIPGDISPEEMDGENEGTDEDLPLAA